MDKEEQFMACSNCFEDQGLNLDAAQIGIESELTCPNCGSTAGRKLPIAGLVALAHRFFVWGSLNKCVYGAAPLIQFNEHQKTGVSFSPWLKQDVSLFERILGVGFFHYEPRLWMFGKVEPLEDLQNKSKRASVIDRILNEYPHRILETNEQFYRLRKAPKEPESQQEYDSRPEHKGASGRLDSPGYPALYASPDLQVCVHECRVTAEDELYVATLTPHHPLKLLNLSVLLKDENVTEFESLDMAVHMLFLAPQHSYEITRSIAVSAKDAGYDGIIYPSYFSLLRLGEMPFQTVCGFSNRRIPHCQGHEEATAIPNLVIFGRPIKNGIIGVKCVNKLILSQVLYNFHFGPLIY